MHVVDTKHDLSHRQILLFSINTLHTYVQSVNANPVGCRVKGSFSTEKRQHKIQSHCQYVKWTVSIFVFFSSSWNADFYHLHATRPRLHLEMAFRCQICDTKKRFHWIFNRFGGPFFLYIGNILRQNVNNVWLVLDFFASSFFPARNIPTSDKEQRLCTFSVYRMAK